MHKSLGKQILPLLNLDLDGSIAKNFYPRILTFPLIWMPPLSGLGFGQSRRTEVSLGLKSGFRRAVTSGFIDTTLEQAEGSLVRLSTRFELDSAPKGWFYGRLPTRFRGQSQYLFDPQLGRMISGEATSDLQQSLTLLNCREAFHMKLTPCDSDSLSICLPQGSS